MAYLPQSLPESSVESPGLAPVVIADPELNGGVSKKRSPVPGHARPLQVAEKQGLSCPAALLRVFHPGKDGPRVHVRGPDDSEVAASAPTLTWEQGIRKILDLGRGCRFGRHGRRVSSTQRSGKAVTRASELGWPRHCRGPCHSIHDGAK